MFEQKLELQSLETKLTEEKEEHTRVNEMLNKANLLANVTQEKLTQVEGERNDLQQAKTASEELQQSLHEKVRGRLNQIAHTSHKLP